jgi:hypothetical protein
VVDRARELGLISPPDRDGRCWSEAAVQEFRGRWPQVTAAIEAARELGAVRCAELLTRRMGLRVSAADVEELSARGTLRVTRLYKHRPMYLVADVEALAADPVARALLTDIAARPG